MRCIHSTPLHKPYLSLYLPIPGVRPFLLPRPDYFPHSTPHPDLPLAACSTCIIPAAPALVPVPMCKRFSVPATPAPIRHLSNRIQYFHHTRNVLTFVNTTAIAYTQNSAFLPGSWHHAIVVLFTNVRTLRVHSLLMMKGRRKNYVLSSPLGKPDQTEPPPPPCMHIAFTLLSTVKNRTGPRVSGGMHAI